MTRPEVEVRWGITLDHVDRVCTMLSKKTRRYLGDDRWEVARTAILELVYTATQPPTTLDLHAAGWRAIRRLHELEMSARGLTVHHDGIHRFAAAYWYGDRGSTPSPEPGIVEHVALWQVFAALTPKSQEALLALAAFGTHYAAAAALGIGYSAFNKRIREGRRQFLELWHQHERPSGMWGASRGAPRNAVTERLWRRKENQRSAQRRKAARHAAKREATP